MSPWAARPEQLEKHHALETARQHGGPVRLTRVCRRPGRVDPTALVPMKTVLVLGYFATWAAIPHLLLLKKRPTATLAWLWAILFIPYLGLIVYALFGTHRLKRRRLERRTLFSAHPSRQRAPASATDEATAAAIQPLPDRDRQFLHLLSRINQLPVSSSETLRILRDATEFYPALERRIRQERQQVHVQFYLWRSDETGWSFLRLLTEAARRGVAVRLLHDGVGSFGLGRTQVRAFRAAGGRFAWFQSLDPRQGRFVLNLRNHRKLQIIDGASAFVGGMNIGREYEGLDPRCGHWRDVQVEVIGSVVQTLQEVFADDWFFATGEKIPETPVTVHRAAHPMHMIVGGADRANEPMSKSIVSLVHEATSRVWIATGYFVPDDALLTALENDFSLCVEIDRATFSGRALRHRLIEAVLRPLSPML